MRNRLLWVVVLSSLGACKCGVKPVEAPVQKAKAPVAGPPAKVQPEAVKAAASRQPLGAGLNVDPARSASVPAVAVQDDGQLLVAWSEIGAVHVRRWNGSAWEVVGGGPATGARTRAVGPPQISIAGEGTVWLAWHEYDKNDLTRVHVARLEGGAWVDSGAELGEKEHAKHAAFSARSAAPVVVWNESDGEALRLRVRRWEGGEWKPVGTGKLFASEKATTLQGASVAVVQGAPVIAWVEREPGKVLAHARRWEEAKQSWLDLPEITGADGDSSLELVAASDGTLYLSLTWNQGQRPLRKLAPGESAWTEVSLPPSGEASGATARWAAVPGVLAMSWPASGMQVARGDGKSWALLDPSLFSGTGNPIPLALSPDGSTVYAAYLDTGPEGGDNAQLRVVSYR